MFFGLAFSSTLGMYFSAFQIHYLVLFAYLCEMVRHVFTGCGFPRNRISGPIPEKKMLTWLQACKEYATRNGKWVVPRKGTAEYDAIRALQGSESSPPAPKKEPKRRVSATEVIEIKESGEAPMKPARTMNPNEPAAPKKVRKPRMKVEAPEEAVLEATEAEAKPEPVPKKPYKLEASPKADVKKAKAPRKKAPTKTASVSAGKEVTFE